jgi:hypothetical protein
MDESIAKYQVFNLLRHHISKRSHSALSSLINISFFFSNKNERQTVCDLFVLFSRPLRRGTKPMFAAHIKNWGMRTRLSSGSRF